MVKKMAKVRRGVGAVGVVALSGCAGMMLSQQQKSVLAKLAAEKTPVTCDGQACADKWSLGQLWVNKHSTMKIQVVTDTIIQTYNPTSNMEVGYTITKVPSGGGKYQIILEPTACKDLLIGCGPNTAELVGAFNHYLATGVDSLTIWVF